MNRAALSDAARFLSGVPGEQGPGRQPVVAVVVDGAKLSFDRTLAFVEQAAETLRSLQRELDASETQALAFANQLQLERRERKAETAKFESQAESWRETIRLAETRAAEAKLVAATAIGRCEDMAAREMRAIQRARAAEARAEAAEAWLAKLQETMESEFSSLFARDQQ